MYKLHKEVSDQVSDEIMFPTASEIAKALPEPVIPEYIVDKFEKKMEAETTTEDENAQINKIFDGIAGGAFTQRFKALQPGPESMVVNGNTYNPTF